ncbi:type II secretion system protein GspG [bacterium]|nr:type II secretion system protein GspG [bacterium]
MEKDARKPKDFLKKEGEGGFTIILLLTVLLFLGFSYRFFTPLTKSSIDSQRLTATRLGMERVVDAISGNSDSMKNGKRIDFGYTGDYGGRPPNLERLIDSGGGRSWSYDPNVIMGYGWNGPYIASDFQETPDLYKYDAWGNTYVYNKNSGSITSLGRDGKTGGEGYDGDITIYLPPETTIEHKSWQLLTLQDIEGVDGFVRYTDANHPSPEPLYNAQVKIYFPNSGDLNEYLCYNGATDTDGYFCFITTKDLGGSTHYKAQPVPFGVRALHVEYGSTTYKFNVYIEDEDVTIPDIVIDLG